MKIKQTVRTETEIEIKLPFYAKETYTYYKCTEDGIYTVNGTMIAFTPVDSFFFEEKVSDVYQKQHITEDEFKTIFIKTKKQFDGI